MGRALLSHPELAKQALILTQVNPGVLTDELRDFIVCLCQAVDRTPDNPKEALLTVPIRKNGVMSHLFFEVNFMPKRPDFDEVVDFWDSEQAIKDFMARRNPTALAMSKSNLKVVK